MESNIDDVPSKYQLDKLSFNFNLLNLLHFS